MITRSIRTLGRCLRPSGALLLLGLSTLAFSTRARAAATASPGSFVSRVTPVAETFDVGMLRVERFGTAHVGTRRAVVLIPGLFCGSWIWNREIDALAPNYDVYAITLPGFDGRRMDRTLSEATMMQRAADDLDRLIESRRLAQPIIVGHSLGGTLAVLFGAAHPAAAGGIIAVEGGYPVAATPEERRVRITANAAPYVHATRATLADSLRLRMLRYVITSAADVDSVARYASRSEPEAVVAWMRAALSLDLTPRLAAIRAPLLEIVPFDSVIDPYQGFRTVDAKRQAYTTWLAHAPHGAVQMIPGSRHFVMLDQPQVFDAMLEAAIERATGIPAAAGTEAISAAAGDTMGTVQWFQRTEQALMNGVTAGDKQPWEETTDSSYVATSEEGQVLSKRELVATIQPLPPGLSGNIQVRELTVQRTGDVAIVRFLADERETVFGQELATKYRTTDTFRRAGDEWKLLASHTSVVTQDPPAQQIEASALHGLAGTYRLQPGGWEFHVDVRDGKLYGGRDPARMRELIPMTNDAFVLHGSLGEWLFVRDASGRATRIVDLRKFEPLIWTRVAE